ncbi:glycosyltransferase [Kineococcus indalonis]|uniref:glycosyltransferase n=1 Tax=Kineococcus indalonis TaxID=2696566 RepID=UPI001412538E|nr:glycosyltransferase [Kineococcus indalonis]NAZ86824.1 glycosyltransferase [Kineococcus indalonis]
MGHVRTERTARTPGTTASARRARIDLIVTDEPAHGLNRYAGVLAGALRAAGHDAREVPVPAGRPLAAARAALRARRADVVHLQLTDRYLGPAWGQLAVAAALRAALAGRPLFVTAHDFHTGRGELLQRRARNARGAARRLLTRLGVVSPGFDATARLLLGSAAGVLTCSATEAENLAWTRPRRSAVVPHYVEELPGEPLPVEQVDEHLVVVAGFVHRRKAQHVAVAALAHLPGHRLVLAGSATERNAGYLREVLELARELGVAERVEVTGYLPDAELLALLRRARVAVAPYERIAASGSLATLVAAGVPVVVRATPTVAELAAACPTAVELFEGEDPAEVAAAVLRCAARPLREQRAELRARAAALSPARTARAHLDVYATATSAAATGGAREEDPGA